MKKLRFIAMMLAALICLGAVGAIGVFAEEYDAAYDVNGDGQIDTKDLTRLMKFISGVDVQTIATDINDDGKSDSKDLTRLMKYLSGGQLGSESKFRKAFNALVNLAMTNGTYVEIDPAIGDGIYSYSESGYTSEGEVYSVGIGYTVDPATGEDSIMIAYTGTCGVDANYRGELIDTLSILITRDTETNKTAQYVLAYDNELAFDFECFIAGEFKIDDIHVDGYFDAYFGDWNETQMLDYTEKLIKHTIFRVDKVILPPDIDLADLGF